MIGGFAVLYHPITFLPAYFIASKYPKISTALAWLHASLFSRASSNVFSLSLLRQLVPGCQNVLIHRKRAGGASSLGAEPRSVTKRAEFLQRSQSSWLLARHPPSSYKARISFLKLPHVTALNLGLAACCTHSNHPPAADPAGAPGHNSTRVFHCFIVAPELFPTNALIIL